MLSRARRRISARPAASPLPAGPASALTAIKRSARALRMAGRSASRVAAGRRSHAPRTSWKKPHPTLSSSCPASPATIFKSEGVPRGAGQHVTVQCRYKVAWDVSLGFKTPSTQTHDNEQGG